LESNCLAIDFVLDAAVKADRFLELVIKPLTETLPKREEQATTGSKNVEQTSDATP